jgi:hypothetical protein
VQHRTSLFDHLVGELLELHRHVKAQGLGGLEVDHKLKLAWRLDREISWLGALEDAVDVPRRLAELFREIGAISDQAS